jgi:glyoxylase-like metal-dependent hydrolase (beta-lactamase superfamily II)
VLGTLILVGVLSMAVARPRGQATAPSVIDIEKLRDNLYVLTSSTVGDPATFSGGNVAVLVTDAGVVLVDTKLAGWGQAMLDKIRTVTTKLVTTIINTHTHGDHTGNNGFFGATVDSITQENTAVNMAKMDAFKGENARLLPKRTFKDRMTIGSGRDRIDLYYFGAGHTNGDAFVVFPALRVLHAGDMVPWKDAPYYDRNNGGSGVSHPQTIANVLAGIKDIDTVVPGHIPVTTIGALEEYQRFSSDLLAAVRSAIKEGRSIGDAAASIDLTTKYKGYQTGRMKAAIEAIYAELKPQP